MVTVLLSAYNEEGNPYFWKTLETIKDLSLDGHQINVVVGVTPGTDETLTILKRLNVSFVEVQSTKRAVRYNEAFKRVTCAPEDWILLHHPRSVLDPDAYQALEKIVPTQSWGAFTHEFDHSHPLLSFTSWWSNHIRGDLKKIFYLDHCLFVRRAAFEKAGGFPEREIFEDTLLSNKLSLHQTPVRLPNRSLTSAVRFRVNGVWTQAWKNQVLKWKFYFNADDEEMNKDYEKGVDLNTEGRT